MKIAIWGTGYYGRILKEYFEEKHEIVCFFDNFSRLQSIDSVNIYKFDMYEKIDFDILYVSNMSAKNVCNIKNQLVNCKQKVIYLYEEDALQKRVFITSKIERLKSFDINGVILHILFNDKFTDGYIEFMQKDLIGYKHVFLVNKNFSMKKIKRNNVCEIINMRDFLTNESVKHLLEKSKKVIISGAFDYDMIMSYPKVLIKKTFIQFWGGDFYDFRNQYLREKIPKFREIVDSCAGVINLVYEDSQAIKKILGLKSNKFYEAPMPSHDNFFRDYKLHKKEKNIVITVGNSASFENNHVEAFDKIKHLVDHNVKICVPLAYGDAEYRDMVVEAGKRMLGSKFFPITDFIPIEQYMQYLADCDVGIFNNDRQQALGNIISLLYLGKKVYLRQDTSMAKFFKRIGVKTFDVDMLPQDTFESLLHMEGDERRNNTEKIELFYSKDNVVTKWREILDMDV